MDLFTLGVEVATNNFSIQVHNQHHKPVFKRAVKRSKLLTNVANLPHSMIGLSDVAHSFSLPPTITQRSKNNLNEVRAICEAIHRPKIPFVPMGSAE